ncbi:MAG: hypothetical protein JRN73_07765 [Nitrososphaerota archaeon]|nr:hypothetical protein [Nitrososphaerota archaeon]
MSFRALAKGRAALSREGLAGLSTEPPGLFPVPGPSPLTSSTLSGEGPIRSHVVGRLLDEGCVVKVLRGLGHA